MSKVRTVVPLVAFFTALAVVTLGRPTTATATILIDASSCTGSILVGGVVKPFALAGQTQANTTTFNFQGTETDIENGVPVRFSFTGIFGPGPGPGPTTTFTAKQTACTSCALAPCKTITSCKVLPAGHPELAKRTSVGVTETNGNAVFVFEPSTGGSPAITAACNSFPSTGK
jgi:hypothetical protein